MTALIVIGGIFALGGLLVFLGRIKKGLQCKGEVMGVCIDNHESVSYDEGARSMTLHPVFQYTVDGKEFTQVSSTGYGWERFKKGQEVRIKYNESDPTKYYVAGEKGSYILGFIFLAIGVAVILIGLGIIKF